MFEGFFAGDAGLSRRAEGEQQQAVVRGEPEKVPALSPGADGRVGDRFGDVHAVHRLFPEYQPQKDHLPHPSGHPFFQR